MRRWIVVPMLAAALVGCPPGEEEPVACTDSEAAVDWDNWGAGFFASYCRSCHSEHSPDRHDAPVGVDFDSEEQVRIWAKRVRSTVLDTGEMPVGGGVPPEQLDLLDVYLECGT